MRFATLAAVATASSAVALPSRRDIGECVISLTSVESSPSEPEFAAEVGEAPQIKTFSGPYYASFYRRPGTLFKHRAELRAD